MTKSEKLSSVWCHGSRWSLADGRNPTNGRGAKRSTEWHRATRSTSSDGAVVPNDDDRAAVLNGGGNSRDGSCYGIMDWTWNS